MNLKEIREWVTCGGTVIMIPLAAWAWLTIQQSTDLKVAALRQNVTDTFETQTAHSTDMKTLSEWTRSIAQGQTEQKLAIQHLTDVLANPPEYAKPARGK